MFDHCELPELDPWDPSILKYLNPLKQPWKNCVPKIKPLTKLIDGQLFLFDNKANGSCFERCLFPVSDYVIKFGQWSQISNGSRPRCDIIEVNCTVIKNGKLEGVPYYSFMHAQTYRKDEPESELSDKSDVHIILFDSVSESQFVRSMPKTRHILREYYESITFKHLNKIGLNSRPNGFALLLGKKNILVKTMK